MKIHSLSYEDLETGWKIENVQFGELNLLVGASGVGKTMILKAIMVLKELINHKPNRAIKWNIRFEYMPNHEFLWGGQTQLSYSTLHDGYFEEEYFKHFGKESIERNREGVITHNGNTIRHLNQSISVLNLIEGYGSLLARAGFRQLRLIDSSVIRYFEKVPVHRLDSLMEAYYKSRNTDRNFTEDPLQAHKAFYDIMNEGAIAMLYYMQKKEQEVFKEVKQELNSIFPNINDVIVTNEIRDQSQDKGKYFKLYFKESEVNKWIPAENTSSGVLKTLLILSGIYGGERGSVLLIDEVENSLGVNCINQLISSLVMSDQDFQFIMTSHHPYVMNHISHSNWKLVTRKDNEVNVQDVDELIDFDKSKQESFIQLVQLEQFHTGVTK